jgi:VanZ family protein
MRLTPYKLMRAFRFAAVLAAVSAVVALTGPFRYRDLGLPFPDTVAHALLFYGLTLAATAALPRSRAAEIAIAMVGIGFASELAQALVGREMSLHDLAGDSVGVLFAYAPVAIGRLRELTRTHPHMTFAELRRIDRRNLKPAKAPALVLETIG